MVFRNKVQIERSFKNMKKVSLCVPCYNEELNIPRAYEQLTLTMQKLTQYDYEIIFEDNASTDASEKILKDLAKKDKHVKVILNTRNFGPSRSGKNCCFNASGDVIISVAADLQNPVSMIPVFLQYWEEGYLVVMGQKTESKENIIKYSLRCLYYKIIQKFSDIPQIPNITGFGAIDAQVYRKIYEMGEYEMSIRHLLADLGYEIKLVPYTQEKRIHGKSSYNLWRNLDFSITSLINTSYLPLRLMTVGGLLCSVLSICVGLIYFIFKLVNWNSYNAGIAPLIIIVSFIGSLQLFFLGILGEYLLKILKKVTIREIVVEKERINFENEYCIKNMEKN